MRLEVFLAQLQDVKQMPSGYAARCPAHDDQIRSLMVNEGDQVEIVLHCHAGCTTDEVVAAMGLRIEELTGQPFLKESYPYHGMDGEVVWTQQRWANPKTFKSVPRLPAPAQRPLFRLPWLLAAPPGSIVYIGEGEQDVITLVSHGYVATCNVGGAGPGKWLPHYKRWLAGFRVKVLADNDTAGLKHAYFIAADLAGWVESVEVLVSPIGKDVTDLFAAGYGVDDLVDAPSEATTMFTLASEITPVEITWAWQSYIPFGKLTMFEGDPGDGKSLLTLELAARWSTGRPSPDGSTLHPPFPVILVSAEDDAGDTIVPRLVQAGANLEHIIVVSHGVDPALPFDFVRDREYLVAKIREVGARVVIFDPLTAFMPDGTDTHNDMSVRKALYVPKLLAEETGCAVIVVRHLNKNHGGKALYRGGGSIAFTAAARCTYLISPDPEDPELRVFVCQKSNLARRPAALLYSISGDQTDWGEVPRITWHGRREITPQELLDGPAKPDPTGRAVGQTIAVDFLLTFTAGKPPQQWRHDIIAAGADAGINARALERARPAARLRLVYGPEGRATSYWLHPDQPTPDGFTDATLRNQNPPFHQNTASGPNRPRDGFVAEWPPGDYGESLEDEPFEDPEGE